jgi:hypothetical protein
MTDQLVVSSTSGRQTPDPQQFFSLSSKMPRLLVHCEMGTSRSVSVGWLLLQLCFPLLASFLVLALRRFSWLISCICLDVRYQQR